MRITLLLKYLLTATCFFVAFSCNRAQSDNKYEFYYYPGKNVYYDVSNARYIYSLNGGRMWDTLYKKADIEPQTLGKKQIIYSSIATPWDSNEVHRNRYGGTLVDIASVDSSLSHQILVADRKSPKKASPVVSTKTTHAAEKKPGFFKRLFGKKH